MHISDGILTQEIVLISSVIGLVICFYSLKKLKNDDIALVASMSALFFISSFIHIPIGPTQIHLILIGIIGLLLGNAIFVAIIIALILQATLLGYGGLSSLGVNLVIMSLPAFIMYKLIKNEYLNFLSLKLKYFFIGFFPVLISSLLLALILALSKEEYIYASYTLLLANIPAMIIEGLITLFLLQYVKKSMPTLLKECNL